MPNPASLAVATTGTHAVLIVGYDDKTGHFIVRNSWGKDWVKKKKKLKLYLEICFYFLIGFGWLFLYSIQLFIRKTSY
jgi:hypothetical protein